MMKLKKGSFLDLYISYAVETTDAPESYHRYMALASLATIMGNNIFLPWGDTRLYPNIWIILLGRSTWDRKTTSMNIGKRLVDRQNLKRVYPNEFSYESLVKLLSDRPSGGFYFSEFKSFLGLLSREYMSGARELLADLFDAPYRFARELSNQTYVIDHPAFSMHACTSLAWFTEGLKASDFGGGFLERFIFVPAEGQVRDMSRRYESDKEKEKEIRDVVRRIRSIKGAFFFDNEAWDINHKWYVKTKKTLTGGRLDPFIGRLHSYLLKFAMLITLNETEQLKCHKEHMEQARDMVEWIHKRLKRLESDEMAVTKEELWASKIRKHLEGQPDGSMVRSELLRISHLSSKQLTQAVKLLTEREEIEILNEKSEKTKRVIQRFVLSDRMEGGQ